MSNIKEALAGWVEGHDTRVRLIGNDCSYGEDVEELLALLGFTKEDVAMCQGASALCKIEAELSGTDGPSGEAHWKHLAARIQALLPPEPLTLAEAVGLMGGDGQTQRAAVMEEFGRQSELLSALKVKDHNG